jgi:uncharacterized membrane protein (UPF0127 family)
MPKSLIVHNNSIPLLKPLTLHLADDFLLRLKGLMFEEEIQDTSGLLLEEKTDSRLSASIHMLFMNFPIGVVWVNSTGLVVDLTIAKPWRLVYQPKEPARFILEIHPSRLAEFRRGDKVEFIA